MDTNVFQLILMGLYHLHALVATRSVQLDSDKDLISRLGKVPMDAMTHEKALSTIALTWVPAWFCPLTHWLLRHVGAIFKSNFPMQVTAKIHEHFLWNFIKVNATEHLWWWVNICSGIVLVKCPSSNSPFTWANVDPDLHQCIMSPGHNELTGILMHIWWKE